MSSPDLCKKFLKVKIINFVNHVKDENCPQCQRTIRNIRVVSRARLAATNGFWFLIGAIAAPFVLYLVSTFWPFWPASHVGVITSALRIASGNAVGCVAYMVDIGTDRGFDHAYVKIRFPFKVSDVKAGTRPTAALSTENSMTSVLAKSGRARMTLVGLRTPQGPTNPKNREGHRKRGRHSILKFQPNTQAAALLVGADEYPLDKTEPPVVHEGHFGSSILGYLAKREITFQDNAVVIAK
jgi:hypothetical protein